MSRRRVVVTGLGLISPVGNSVAEGWGNLLAGRSGIDYPGGDYRSFPKPTWQSCSRACFVDTQCKAFTYDTSDRTCWLKNQIVDASFVSHSIAGRK